MGHKLNTYVYVIWFLIYIYLYIYTLIYLVKYKFWKTFYIQNKRVHVPNKLEKYLLEI